MRGLMATHTAPRRATPGSRKAKPLLPLVGGNTPDQRRAVTASYTMACMVAEEFPEYLCEVVCNGVPMALQQSKYYRRQAADQLEGPDAPFPFEEEIAKQIHTRSIAQARVA